MLLIIQTIEKWRNWKQAIGAVQIANSGTKIIQKITLFAQDLKSTE